MKDGWNIDEEQYIVSIDRRNLWIDIRASSAEQQLAILVEVKELSDVQSPIEALANAVGKFIIYRLVLQSAQVDFPLFLAVTEESYQGILSERIGQLVLDYAKIPVIVFDHVQENVVRWIP